MLRNPSVINFLDGCALSVPCHAPGEAPVGLMIAGLAMQDEQDSQHWRGHRVRARSRRPCDSWSHSGSRSTTVA